MPKYMLFPFAEDGTKTAIDNDTQPSGLVSWEEGFGADYQGDILTDPDARPFPRAQFNQLCFDMSSNIQYWQQNVFPAFISTADNGGSPFPYKAGAIVQYPSGTGNPLYRSLVNSNTALPTDTTKWGLYDNMAGKLTLDNAVLEGTVVNGNIVYFNSGSSNFQKAVPDGSAAQNAVGIADVTNSRVITNGQCAVVSGLSAGVVYYLSSGTPGALTATPGIVKVGIALTATLLLVNIQISSIGSAGQLSLDNAAFEGTVANGNAVYYNSGSSNFQKAQANNTAAQNAVGIADVSNGLLVMSGQCAVVSGLTPGLIYYLSAGSPGAISTTVSGVKIGIAITSTLLLVDIQINTLNQSLAAPSGYCEFPNGIILQWGVSGSIAANASATQTFPIAFPNAFLTGSATSQTAPGTAAGQAAGILNTGTTSMDITNCSITAADSFVWIAWGH